jgi:hypothetical protein
VVEFRTGVRKSEAVSIVGAFYMKIRLTFHVQGRIDLPTYYHPQYSTAK